MIILSKKILFSLSKRTSPLALFVVTASLLFPQNVPVPPPTPPTPIPSEVPVIPREENPDLPIPPSDNPNENQNDNPSENQEKPTEETPPIQPLPEGYPNYPFGSSFDEISTLLKEDTSFQYAPEDVSFLRTPVRRIISTKGSLFFTRGEFLFNESDQLYTVVLNFNREQIDFFTLFNQLRTKYGEPESYTPKKGAIWRNETLTLSLEYPLTLKYLANGLINDISAREREQETLLRQRRQEFLEQF